MTRWRMTSVAWILAFVGCEPAASMGPARDASPVQTDAAVYTLTREPGAWRAYALATYRNTGSQPLRFPRCMPADTLPTFGVRRTGADSARPLFSDQAWACVGGVATGSVAPGAALSVRVVLGSVDQPRMEPPLQLDWLTGRMRVVLDLCEGAAANSEDCVLLPQAARQSNEFEVRLRP